jgi:hypothetical protein
MNSGFRLDEKKLEKNEKNLKKSLIWNDYCIYNRTRFEHEPRREHRKIARTYGAASIPQSSQKSKQGAGWEP